MGAEGFPKKEEQDMPESTIQEMLDALDRGETKRGAETPPSFESHGYTAKAVRGDGNSGKLELENNGLVSITHFGYDGKALRTELFSPDGETLTDQALRYNRQRDAYRIFHGHKED